MSECVFDCLFVCLFACLLACLFARCLIPHVSPFFHMFHVFPHVSTRTWRKRLIVVPGVPGVRGAESPEHAMSQCLFGWLVSQQAADLDGYVAASDGMISENEEFMIVWSQESPNLQVY